MFLLNETVELDEITISQIIQEFMTSERPKLQKWYNYYIGKQNILLKENTNDLKPCNRIVSNYCNAITTAYGGYLTGKEIGYTSDEDITTINEILRYNDVADEDAHWLKDALIFGTGYEICYIDGDGQQRMKVLDPRECIPVYSSGLDEELKAVIRFYTIPNLTVGTDMCYVDVYEDKRTRHYISNNGWSSLEPTGEDINYYNMVPITVFNLNDDKESIFNQIIGLQDAYNTLISSSVDDFEAFADAYMIVNDVKLTDEQVEAIRQNRIFNFWGDKDGSVEYLTKDIKTTQIENLLNRIDEKIHTIANLPNFTDSAFGTSSGVALRYKLLGFENAASSIEKKFIKAIQRRIELFCSILSLTDDDMWRDIKIIFHRNLPENIDDIVSEVNALRGLVSDRTLISQLPFIDDVDKEIELLNEQKAQYATIYNIDNEKLLGE